MTSPFDLDDGALSVTRDQDTLYVTAYADVDLDNVLATHPSSWGPNARAAAMRAFRELFSADLSITRDGTTAGFTIRVAPNLPVTDLATALHEAGWDTFMETGDDDPAWDTIIAAIARGDALDATTPGPDWTSPTLT